MLERSLRHGAGGQGLPQDLTSKVAVGLGWQVMGFALAVSLASGLLFGLIPPIQSSVRSPLGRFLGARHDVRLNRPHLFGIEYPAKRWHA